MALLNEQYVVMQVAFVQVLFTQVWLMQVRAKYRAPSSAL